MAKGVCEEIQLRLGKGNHCKERIVLKQKKMSLKHQWIGDEVEGAQLENKFNVADSNITGRPANLSVFYQNLQKARDGIIAATLAENQVYLLV